MSLQREGFAQTETPDGADLLLVNTCAVRDNAEQRVIGRLGELQRYKPAGGVLGVVGCMAQRLGPTLLGAGPQGGHRRRARRLSKSPCAGRARPPRASAPATPSSAPGSTTKTFRRSGRRPRAPSSRCSAAAITSAPSASFRIRGDPSAAVNWRTWSARSPAWPNRAPARSRSLGRRSTAITTAPTISRICYARSARWTVFGGCAFTSPYPTDFTDRVIEAMADGARGLRARPPAGAERLQRGAPSHAAPLHPGALPRGGCPAPGGNSRHHLLDRHHRRLPGETEEQFEETLSLVAEAEFDDAYTFKYSVREGTPAVRIPGHIADEVAGERLERLIAAVRNQARRKNMGRVGTVHEVLVERPARRGDLLLARTRTNLMALVDLPAEAIGEYHQVQLTGTTGSTFTGAVARPSLAVL